ncbi:MAG: tRNA (adenosine(37)-N6)-dimethylallyltransferase MiaA [Actinomycetota bacterium]
MEPLLALVGPTASGKTDAAERLAPRLGVEIVSVDSMSVYRGMDVGTAKPSPEQRARVRHHLLDVAEPGEEFSVARYQRLAREAMAEIEDRGSRPLLVGGTGLYFRAVVDDLEFPPTDPEIRRALEAEAEGTGPEVLHATLAAADPEAASRIEPGNVRRTVRALEVAAVTGRPFSSFGAAWERFPPERVRAAGVELPAETLRDRIERRVRSQFEAGLLEEIRALLAHGAGPSLTARQAIGYAEAIDHVAGRISLDEAAERTVKRTRALARRQLSWFRRDPRIRWFRAGTGGASELIDDLEEFYRRG